jgi:hypothetical protein
MSAIVRIRGARIVLSNPEFENNTRVLILTSIAQIV